MPMPFHCHECDAPTPNLDGLCGECKRQANMATSTSTGEPMDNLPSVKQQNDKSSNTEDDSEE